MSVKKVVIVTNIPNPYRLPLFNELNRQLSARGIKLKLLFGSQGSSRRKFNLDLNDCAFDFEFLHSSKINTGDEEKIFFTYKGFRKAIRREKPDVIIVSGFSIVTLMLWFRSLFIKTNYIIWSGSVSKKGYNDSVLRLFVRRLLARKATACITYGTLAKNYLLQLGVPDNRIFIAINTVDTEFFSNRTNFHKNSLKQLDGKKHLTYVGYLSERKNVMSLLKVMLALAKRRNDFILDVIGDGNERGKLEQYVKENQLSQVVKFHGFVQKEQLPEYFSISSCFLFQTGFDIWGLVLNEAMAAGLPCIASIEAGATNDLINDGKNGFSVDFEQQEEAIEKINWMLDHEKEANQMGSVAARFIAEHASLEISASGFIKAIELGSHIV